jgi:uncharacterized protein (TIGR03086 family)
MNLEATTPPSAATDPAPADPRPLFGGAVAVGTATLANVRPDQLDRPTPCGQQSVRQVMGHLVDVLHRVGALGRGDNPFARPPLDAAAVGDGEWVTLWSLAHHDMEQDWADDAVLHRTMVLPWATAPGATQLCTYINEVTVHTWDIAAATGQQPAWNADVVQAALDAMMRALPAGHRQAEFEAVIAAMPPGTPRSATMPFAEVVPVSADAPLIDRLVAWNGRQP